MLGNYDRSRIGSDDNTVRTNITLSIGDLLRGYPSATPASWMKLLNATLCRNGTRLCELSSYKLNRDSVDLVENSVMLDSVVIADEGFDRRWLDNRFVHLL